MSDARIGIIGGSGFYEMEGLSNVREVEVDTPFGKPSDSIVLGTLVGKPVAFLPRHGRGHRINPTNIPVRANIYALKTLGVERLISISAVGSLKEEFEPLHMVVPDQLIDRTRQRAGTFFDDGMVVHVSFAEPFCPEISSIIYQSAKDSGAVTHLNATCVVMEGPAFSTKAESFMYRLWGADIIGMTALPEAKIAREAEMCYAILACVTDYDCWHETEEAVTVDMVVANVIKNTNVAKDTLLKAIPQIPSERTCFCATALKDAIITSRDTISPEMKDKLAPIIGKYLD